MKHKWYCLIVIPVPQGIAIFMGKVVQPVLELFPWCCDDNRGIRDVTFLSHHLCCGYGISIAIKLWRNFRVASLVGLRLGFGCVSLTYKFYAFKHTYRDTFRSKNNEFQLYLLFFLFPFIVIFSIIVFYKIFPYRIIGPS